MASLCLNLPTIDEAPVHLLFDLLFTWSGLQRQLPAQFTKLSLFPLIQQQFSTWSIPLRTHVLACILDLKRSPGARPGEFVELSTWIATSLQVSHPFISDHRKVVFQRPAHGLSPKWYKSMFIATASQVDRCVELSTNGVRDNFGLHALLISSLASTIVYDTSDGKTFGSMARSITQRCHYARASLLLQLEQVSAISVHAHNPWEQMGVILSMQGTFDDGIDINGVPNEDSQARSSNSGSSGGPSIQRPMSPNALFEDCHVDEDMWQEYSASEDILWTWCARPSQLLETGMAMAKSLPNGTTPQQLLQ